MTNQSRPSLLQQLMEASGPVQPRSLAILMMVAGAIGFAVSLVVFGGQVLCLLGSTLIVFAGLWFNVLVRRHQIDAAQTVRESRWVTVKTEQNSNFRGSIPHQMPAPFNWTQMQREPAEPEPVDHPHTHAKPVLPPLEPGATGLTGLVSEVLRQQGAQVRVEAKREDRSILQVRSPSGETFTALVLEGQAVVDVSEVRGLFGLMTGSGSSGAFMVSGGSYTLHAQNWARQRSLTLLEAGQINEIRID